MLKFSGRASDAHAATAAASRGFHQYGKAASFGCARQRRLVLRFALIPPARWERRLSPSRLGARLEPVAVIISAVGPTKTSPAAERPRPSTGLVWPRSVDAQIINLAHSDAEGT